MPKNISLLKAASETNKVKSRTKIHKKTRKMNFCYLNVD